VAKWLHAFITLELNANQTVDFLHIGWLCRQLTVSLSAMIRKKRKPEYVKSSCISSSFYVHFFFLNLCTYYISSLDNIKMIRVDLHPLMLFISCTLSRNKNTVFDLIKW